MPIVFKCKNCGEPKETKKRGGVTPKYCSHECASGKQRAGGQSGRFKKHLIIPDLQIRPGEPIDYIGWIGKYVADKQPDTVVQIGDFADMPSLSQYDKGKKCFEGRRYKKDIDASNFGLDKLMSPISKMKKVPRLVVTEGNHENRINIAVEKDAMLEGVIGTHDFNFKKHGWEVYPFLKTVEIDGILYAHYFYNQMTGKPLGGNAHTLLKTVGKSFTQGHRQGIDFATRTLPNGEKQNALIAGSCYLHDEEYKGPQANAHFRGIIVCHEVFMGNYDIMVVSLDYLRRRYS